MIHKPPGRRVVGFSAPGGLHLLLQLDDGDVGAARHIMCPTCKRLGLIPGTNESLGDVRAWARAVGFRWPRAERRELPDTKTVSGCIELVVQSAVG